MNICHVDFLFASSNPLWRATMQKLSFAQKVTANKHQIYRNDGPVQEVLQSWNKQKTHIAGTVAAHLRAAAINLKSDFFTR